MMTLCRLVTGNFTHSARTPAGNSCWWGRGIDGAAIGAAPPGRPPRRGCSYQPGFIRYFLSVIASYDK
jgi:hypothetical protein